MAAKDLAKIKIYGTLWNDEETGATAVAQQIWDTERECWVSEYPDLFGGGDPGELPNIPRIDKTLTLADYAADSYEVGIRLKKLQQDIDNFPIPKPEMYRGNITLTELLLINNPENGLMYNVYNSGNEEEGYGTENFLFNGKTYLAGSTMVYEVDHWRVKDPEEDDKEFKAMSFQALQNRLILPFNANKAIVYPNTRNNAYKTGLKLFDAYIYNLTDDGYVREYATEAGTTSDKWTFMLPYARFYSEGSSGEMIYNSGILTAEQLRYLYEHHHNWNEIEGKPNFHNVAFTGSYNDLSDTPENLESVVKYVSQTLTETEKAQARQNIGAGTSNFSGNYNDLIGKPQIPDEVTNVVKYVSQSLTTAQKAQARTNIGAGTGNGTVTSVSVKMNGTTKGTVTSSGEINLGTVLTEHQSLDGYLPLTGGTIHNPNNGTGLWIKAGDYTSAGIGFYDKDGAPVGILQGRSTNKKRPVWESSGNYPAEFLALLSDIPSLDGYALQSWVTGQGYTKNTGTVTSVSVKINGEVMGTVTTSGIIDLGTITGGSTDTSDKMDRYGNNAYPEAIENLAGKLPTVDTNDQIGRDYRMVFLDQGAAYNVSTRWLFGAQLTATEFSDEDDKYDKFHAPSQKLFVDTIKEINSRMLTRSYIVLFNTGSDKPLGIEGRTNNINVIHTGDSTQVSYIKLKINDVTNASSFKNFMLRHVITATRYSSEYTQCIMNVSLNPIRFENDPTYGPVVLMSPDNFSGTSDNPGYLMITFDKLW